MTVADEVRVAAMRELVHAFDTSEAPLSSLAWWSDFTLCWSVAMVRTDMAMTQTKSSDAAVLRAYAEALEESCGDRLLEDWRCAR